MYVLLSLGSTVNWDLHVSLAGVFICLGKRPHWCERGNQSKYTCVLSN